MGVIQIEKRDKTVVPFNQAKIWKAISKAFLDVKGNFTAEQAKQVDEVTESVVLELDTMYGEVIPSVENVQDIVERKLMETGFYDVAKGYILYRNQHQQARQEDLQKKQDLHPTLKVRRSSGSVEPLDVAVIRETLIKASHGYESDIDIDIIVSSILNSIYDGITTAEIDQLVIMSARSFIEKDPAYSYLSARLLLNTIYTKVLGEGVTPDTIDEMHRTAFVQNMSDAINLQLLDGKMRDYNLEYLSTLLKPERDGLFKFLGVQTIEDRYLLTDPVSKRVFETPQIFWMRVAMGLGLAENPEMREQRVAEFYEVLSQQYFTPSTPTLFHAGTNHPQLSSCYLNTVEDDLSHIFKVIGDNAQMSKWSGGLGTDWTNLRATGALIRGTGVESQGVIPFLKIANDMTAAINRSGKRRGAAVAYMEVWHFDIEDFLELRKNTGDERRRTHDMNTANWIPDLFMERVRTDGDWTLFSPDETPELHHIYGEEFRRVYESYEVKAREGKLKIYRVLKAQDLWKKMITLLFETGHPWITFKDPSNIRSPQDHVGVVHNSNLCTEITLNNSAEETAVCNLGSLNLKNYIKNGSFDVDLVKKVVPVAMRMLDNVIDINFYPTVEGKLSNLRHRPVGLGIMGFQDALYQLDIPFDSEEAVQFADESMEVISYYAILSSSLLAKEKGAYESFHGSKWDRGILPLDTIELLEQSRHMQINVDRSSKLDWTPVRESIRQFGMRNSNTMAMAPTATISNIVGAIPTIEPIYKNLYVKSNQAGDFIVINEYLIEDLKKLNLWNTDMADQLKYFDGVIDQIPHIPQHLKDKYKEVFDIDARWMIKAAAYRGKWIDQSQSLNIFYKGLSGREVADIYMYAWEMGVKTTYYLRTLAISQVEKSTVDTGQFGKTHKRSFEKSLAPTTHESIAPQTDPVIEVSNPEPAQPTAPVFPKVSLAEIAKRPNIVAIAEGQICESCQ